MRKINYYITVGFMACAAQHVHADIYDLLKGTEPSNNLTYNDVQAVAAAGGADQQPTMVPNTLPPPPAEKPTTMRDEAFKEMLNKTFPMKPDQIQELHREYDKTQIAINAPPYAPPQPIFSTLNVDLSPGSTPPLIRLATGFVTSMVFMDSTGQPWPVADYSLGNPQGFNIKWDSKTNALFVQSTKDHISGNIAIRLANLDTPIMVSIVTGQKEVDYRVDLLVPGTGPNAVAPVLDSLPQSGAQPALLGALDGVPPTGSIELKLDKDYGRVWLYNGKLIFRTKLTLLSPAWSASVSSQDGTRVYELVQTPLLLVSQNGKPVKIELAGL